MSPAQFGLWISFPFASSRDLRRRQVTSHQDLRIMALLPRSRLTALHKFLPCGAETTCIPGKNAYLSRCPNRTCLWSCAGGRGSGQEAGQPLANNRQPEANRRTPPNGGRDLKQRRTGLFRLCQFPKLASEEACLSCRACGSGSPFPNDGHFKPWRANAFRGERVQRRST